MQYNHDTLDMSVDTRRRDRIDIARKKPFFELRKVVQLLDDCVHVAAAAHVVQPDIHFTHRVDKKRPSAPFTAYICPTISYFHWNFTLNISISELL